MQTPKGRSISSELPRKVYSQAVHQPKAAKLESSGSGSTSKIARKTSKDGSPKTIERRSPKSLVIEKKQSPSRISELETQVAQLREELKTLQDQLVQSDSWKREAQEDAENSKKQLLDTYLKLEEIQKQILELSAAKKTSASYVERPCALNEVHQLKFQLETVGESEAAKEKHTDLADLELETLRENLNETLLLVANMRGQLQDSKEAEAQAQELASNTLMQLDAAKQAIAALNLDGTKTIEAYNSIASELDQSKGRVNLLEKLISELNREPAEGYQLEQEVSLLRSALEVSEANCHEEEIRSTVEIRSAYEMAEKIKSASVQRESELEGELKRAKADIEQLKAELMDKETELRCVSKENQSLNTKMANNDASRDRELELEKEIKKLKENIADLKNSLMDRETELQIIAEENEDLKTKIKARDASTSHAKEAMEAELEAMKSRESEAVAKLELAMHERDKSNRKVERATEQLEAAQSVNAEMEAELRRIKVQSDQWRKAAEAAAAVISNGKGKFVDRTESLDGVYNISRSPYDDDEDDDLIKKKNGNMLKRIGVMWKKHQK